MIPFTYQLEGSKFLAGRKIALLADEMRLGKTCQAIMAADAIQAREILVICPAGVKAVWAREIERFRTRWSSIWDIVSYNKVAEMPDRPLDLVIVDEAHYCKNPVSKRTVGVYRCLKMARYRWFLTGTPAPNNYSELWTMLRWAGRYKLTQSAFIADFCTGYVGAGDRFIISGHKRHAPDAIKAMLDGFMLRRTLAEVFPDLPPILIDTVPVDIDPAHEVELKDSEGLLNFVLDDAHDLPDVVSMTTWRRMVGIAKVAGAIALIKETLEQGCEKLVVFAYHREVIENLSRAFPLAAVIHGGVEPQRRSVEIARFNTAPGCQIFIGQITAAGVGIDLSVAHEGIMVEQSWVPGDNQQAVMRMSGVRQKMPVRVRICYLDGLVDEKVTEVLTRKIKDLMKIL